MNHKSIQNESRLNHESIRDQRNGNKHNTYTHAQPREDIDIDKDNNKTFYEYDYLNREVLKKTISSWRSHAH